MGNIDLIPIVANPTLSIAEDTYSSFFYDEQYKCPFTSDDLEQFKKSAIIQSLAELNIWRINNIKYLQVMLNNPGINCGGLVFQPANIDNTADSYICFKPDIPKKARGKNKFNKYLNTNQKDLDIKIHRTKGPVFLRWHLEAFNKLCQRYPDEFADVTFEYDAKTGEVFGVWEYIILETMIPLAITEGDKKALALMSIGFASMSIRGCTLGDFEWDNNHGRIFPGKFWQEYFTDQRDRVLFVILDGDDSTNQGVAQAKVQYFALQFYYGMSIKDFDWSGWEEQKIDDLLAKHGEAGFDTFYQSARNLNKWLAQHDQEFTTAGKNNKSLQVLADCCKPKQGKDGNAIPLPTEKQETDGMPSGLLAKYLFTNYLKHTVRFDDTTKQFFTRGTEKKPLSLASQLSEVTGDSWRMCKESKFRKYLIDLCDDNNIELPTHSYTSDMVKVVRDLSQIDEQPKSEYLGFTNGVMELHTNQYKKQHSPQYTNQFIHDFPYKPNIVKDKQELLVQLHKKCPTIFKFIARLQEYEEYDVLRTLACIKAYVHFWLSDFQYFILIMGPQGSSKSVFLKFLSYLIDPVGFKNCKKSFIVGGISPYDLADRQMLFDLMVKTSAIHVPEVKRLSSDMQDTIKKLVAQDEFTVRPHHQEAQRERYKGNLVIVSNGDPFFFIELDGIDRRKIIFNFENPVKKSEKETGFEKKLIKESEAFLNLLLPAENFSKEDVQAYLDNISDKDKHYNLVGASNNEEQPIDNIIINQLIPCPGKTIKVRDVYDRLQMLNPDDKFIKSITPSNFSRALKTKLNKYNQFDWENIQYYRADQYKEAGILENTTSLGNCRLREADDTDIETYTERAGEKRNTGSKKLNIPGLVIPDEYLPKEPKKVPVVAKSEAKPASEPEPVVIVDPTPQPEKEPELIPETVVIAEPVSPQPEPEIITEIIPEPTPTDTVDGDDLIITRTIENKHPQLYGLLSSEITDDVIPVLNDLRGDQPVVNFYKDYLMSFGDSDSLQVQIMDAVKRLNKFVKSQQ